VRVGVIGCGAVAHYCHLPALLRIPGVRVVAVADTDERIRNRAVKAAGCPAFKSAEFLLANTDVDAVVISTPPATHASIGTMAARAGKAIYMEKPIATSLQDAIDLAGAAAAARVSAVVGFNKRCHPLYLRARAMIQRGAIGELRALQTIFCEPVSPGAMPAWKAARSSGGGAPLDLASHHVDIARWMSGAEVSTINAQLRSDDSEHDSASMQMTLTTGASVQTFVSFRAGYAERIVLIGDKGTIEIDRHRGSLSLQTARQRGYGARRRMMTPSLSDLPWKMRRALSPGYDPSYHRALSAFALHSDLLPSLHDGEMSLRVVLAAEESARRGSPVEVTKR